MTVTKKRIAQATFIVVFLSILSKIAGFAREQLMAFFFGATGQTDAYMVANTIATLVVGMISGPLSTAFLPLFAGRVAQGDREGALKFASTAVTVTSLTVLGISVLAVFPAPTLVRLVAPGFTGERLQTTVTFTRMFLPIMVFPLLSAFSKSILNTYDEFAVPALAPVLQNLVIITVISVFAPTMGIMALAVGVVLGYVVAFASQLPALRAQNGLPGLSVEFDESTGELLKLAGPLMVGTLFAQLYTLVDKYLASGLEEGSIAVLGYADRIRQLPLGLFVTAVVTVLLPALSRMWANEDDQGFRETILLGLRYVEFICIPSAVGLFILSQPLVRLTLERGVFSGDATSMTAAALRAYSPALVAMAATQVVVASFYSSRETRIPVGLSVVTALFNTVLDVVLVRYMGHTGLALANSIAHSAGALVGLYLLNRLIDLPFRELGRSLTKILVASGAMGLSAFGLARWLDYFGSAANLRTDLAKSAVVLGGAILTYLVVAAALKCEELSMVSDLLKSRVRERK